MSTIVDHLFRKKSLLYVVVLMPMLCSCQQKAIAPGCYQVVGFQFNQSVDNGFMTAPMPVFDFRKQRTLVITPDFPDGYFQDSVFTYRIKDGYLELKGETTSHRLVFEKMADGSAGPAFQLFINSDKIRIITIKK